MRILTALTFCASLAAITYGCDRSDDFADAPSVSAPEKSAQYEPGASDSVESSDSLPPNHPPIGEGSAPGARAGGAGDQPSFSSPEEYGKVGPLRWSAPERWQAARPASSMRLAEYVIPGSEGAEAATMSIFYFGAAGGGGVEANVARWIGQFSPTDGRSAQEAARREQRTINSMTVHIVDVAGSFDPGMAGSGPAKDEQRMLGAIAESPVGLYFFKVVGPTGTVDEAVKEFDAFVASFAPAK